jgi:hypothetical protein
MLLAFCWWLEMCLVSEINLAQLKLNAKTNLEQLEFSIECNANNNDLHIVSQSKMNIACRRQICYFSQKVCSEHVGVWSLVINTTK